MALDFKDSVTTFIFNRGKEALFHSQEALGLGIDWLLSAFFTAWPEVTV